MTQLKPSQLLDLYKNEIRTERRHHELILVYLTTHWDCLKELALPPKSVGYKNKANCDLVTFARNMTHVRCEINHGVMYSRSVISWNNED